MDFFVKTGIPETHKTDCLVLGIHESRKLTPGAHRVDKASSGAITRMMRSGDMDGKRGQVLMLHDLPGVAAARVLLVGCGPEKDLTDSVYRELIARAVKTLGDTGAKQACFDLAELAVRDRDIYWNIRAAVESAHGALYRFDQCKSKKERAARALSRMAFLVANKREVSQGELAVRDAVAISAGVQLVKDLGNLPGNICTPSYLANQAKALAKGRRKIKVEVLDEAQMKKLGMGALLSVSRGSRQPAKLIVLKYSGAAARDKPVVLVGKGLTFDAGGISIKPAQGMDEMKYDMCGGASVLGAIQAAADLQLPLNVVGIIPSSENLPDGNANKPGDIVTSMSGQTIEILNTDAEGRLILCDALTYAERFHPDVVIDIATLTGACVVALGKHASGLLGNHEPLIDKLLEAGKATGDRAWQMPLWDDYQEQLKSNFADMANVGGREAGTITGACFLARYTRQYRWAHLDIAGTAWKTGGEKGATGRPVPLLVQYLIDRCGRRGAGRDR